MDWWNQRHFSNVAPVIVNSLEINVRMFKSSLIFVFYRFALLSFINYCCFGGCLTGSRFGFGLLHCAGCRRGRFGIANVDIRFYKNKKIGR